MNPRCHNSFISLPKPEREREREREEEEEEEEEENRDFLKDPKFSSSRNVISCNSFIVLWFITS